MTSSHHQVELLRGELNRLQGAGDGVDWIEAEQERALVKQPRGRERAWRERPTRKPREMELPWPGDGGTYGDLPGVSP